MTEQELRVLLAAAQKANLDPTRLKPQNPYRMEGAVAKSMQIAVESVDPIQAARWKSDAGHTHSLAAAAARIGMLEHTPQTKQELRETDPDFVAGELEAKAAWEAKMLANFDEARDHLATHREKQQAAFKRQSNSNATGQHNQSFLRSIGGVEGLKKPARRLLGN